MNQPCRIRSGFTNQSDTIYTFITTNPPEEKSKGFTCNGARQNQHPPARGASPCAVLAGRGTGRTHPPRSVRKSEVLARPFHAVQHISRSRRGQSDHPAPPEARPGPRAAATETHRAAERPQGQPQVSTGGSSAAPRGRNQGRGGRHHLVSHPPPAAPASPGTKGGQRRLPRRRAGRGRQKTLAPTRGDEARHPQSDHPPPGAAGRRPPPPRLTSRRREAPQPRRNSRMLLRHSPSVRGSGYTCKRRGGRSARAAAPNRAARLPPSAAPQLPAAPRTSCSLRRRRRRRSLPVRGLNREVNTEHRKWRARAGAPRPGAAPGSPASAAGRAASAGRGGRRGEGRGGKRGEAKGRERKRGEEKGKEGREARPGHARSAPPRVQPQPQARPVREAGAPQSSQLSIF